MKLKPLCKSILATALSLTASFSAFSQNPTLGQNDNCSSALRLCAPKTITAINHLATDDDAQVIVGGGTGCIGGPNKTYIYKGQWYKISSLDGGLADLRLKRNLCAPCGSNAFTSLGFAYALYQGGTCSSGNLVGATVVSSGCLGNVGVNQTATFPINLDPCEEYWLLVGTNQPVSGAITSNSLSYDVTIRCAGGGARGRCIVGFPETDLRLTDLQDNPLSFVICGNKSDTRQIKLHNDSEEFTDLSCGSKTVYELAFTAKDKAPTASDFNPVPPPSPSCVTCWGRPGFDTIIDLKKLDLSTICNYSTPYSHSDTIPIDSIRITLRAKVICDINNPSDICGEPEQYGNSTNFEERVLQYHHAVFDSLPHTYMKGYDNENCGRDTIRFIAAFPTNTERDGYDTSTVFQVIWTLKQPKAGAGSPFTTVTFLHDYSATTPPQFDTLVVPPTLLRLSGTYRLSMRFTEFCNDGFVDGLASNIYSYPTCGDKELIFYIYKRPKIDHITSTWDTLEGNEVQLYHAPRDLDLGKSIAQGGDFFGYSTDTLCAYDSAFVQLFKYVDPDGYGYGNSTYGYGGSIPASADIAFDNPPNGGWGAGPRFRYIITGQRYPATLNTPFEYEDNFPPPSYNELRTDTTFLRYFQFTPQSDSVLYSYNIHIIDSLNCTSDTTLELFVRPKPKIDFTTNSFRRILCNKDTVDLSAYITTPHTTSFDTYHWRAELDGNGDKHLNYLKDTITYSPSYVPVNHVHSDSLSKNRYFRTFAYEEPIDGLRASFGREHYRGCVTDTARVLVTVGKSPDVTILPFPTELCRGTVTFTLNINNDSLLQPKPHPNYYLKYKWTVDNRSVPGDDVIWLGTDKDTVQAPIAANVKGDAVVSVYVTEVFTGCNSLTYDTIQQPDTAGTATISMSPDSACYAGVTLSAALDHVNGACDDDPNNGAVGSVFEWSSDNVLVQFNPNDFSCTPIASYVNANDKIMLKVIDLLGCEINDTIQVPKPVTPAVSFDRTAICRNDSSGIFTASISRLPANARKTAYISNGVNGQVCFDINYVPRTIPNEPDRIQFIYKGRLGSSIAQDCGSGDYTATIVIDDKERGCYDSTSYVFKLTILPTPDPFTSDASSRFEILYNPNDTVCTGTDVTLTAKGATGYVWDNFLTGPVRTKYRDSLALGMNLVHVNGSIGLCSVLLRDTILVQLAPPAPIFSDSVVLNAPGVGDTSYLANYTPCVGSNHLYQVANPTAGTFYYWFLNSSSGSQLDPGYQSKDSMRVSWGLGLNSYESDQETFFVYGLNPSTQCKTDTAEKLINIRPYPRIFRHTFTGDNYLCAQDTAEYHITGDGPASTVRFRWSVLRNNGTVIADSDPNDSSVTIVWNKDTTITDSIVVYSYDSLALDKCVTGPEYFPIYLKENPRKMPITADRDTVCEGDAVTIMTTDIPTYRYFWHMVCGDSSINTLSFFQQRNRLQINIDSIRSDDSICIAVGYRDTITGCANVETITDTITIHLKAKPELPHPTIDKHISCQGGVILMNITDAKNVPSIKWKVRKLDPNAPPPGKGNGFGEFSPSDNVDIVTYKPDTTASDTGWHVFTVIVKNLPCAVDSDTVMVYVKPFPKAIITPSDTMRLCEGTPLVFGGPGMQDTTIFGIPHWTVDNTCGVKGTLNNYDIHHPVYTPAPGEHCYTTFTLTSSNGGICDEGMDKFVVEYKEQPRGKIANSDFKICIDSTGVPKALITVVPASVPTYFKAAQLEWRSYVVGNPTQTGGTIAPVGIDNRTVQFTSNGGSSGPQDIAIVLKVTNAPCTESLDTVIVTIMPQNTGDFADFSPKQYCQGAYNIPLHAESNFSDRNKWKFYQLTTPTKTEITGRFINPATGQRQNDLFDELLEILPTDPAGTYQIVFIAGNDYCGEKEYSRTFEIFARPEILTVSPSPAPRCADNPATVSLTVTVANGSVPAFKWTVSPAGPVITNSTTATATVKFQPTNATITHTFTITATSSVCPGFADTRTVTVFTRETPKIQPVADKSALCPGEQVTLRVGHSPKPPAMGQPPITPTFQYTWTPNPATLVLDANGSTNNEIVVSSPTVTTTYTIFVQEKTANMPSCSVSQSLVVKVYKKPLISTSKLLVCYNDDIKLTAALGPDVKNGTWATTAPSNKRGTWTPNEVFTNQTGNINISYKPSEYDIALGYVEFRIEASGLVPSCPLESDIVRVNIAPKTFVEAGAIDSSGNRVTDHIEISIGESVKLDGKSDNQTGSAEWKQDGKNTGTFQPDNQTANATYLPSDQEYQSGGFTLEYSNVNGCDKPPKSDLISVTVKRVNVPKAFTPNGDEYNQTFAIAGLPANSKLVVFDRWGRKVYESDNYKNDWDGNNLAAGTYYYVLTYKLGSAKGYVTLIK